MKTNASPARHGGAGNSTPKRGRKAPALVFAVGANVWVQYGNGKAAYAAEVVNIDPRAHEYCVRYEGTRNSDEWVQADMVKNADFFNTRRREKRTVQQYQS